MKWSRQTQVFMWAHYFSEDGKWKAWCEDKKVESNRKRYNPRTRQYEAVVTLKIVWFLKNLETGEVTEGFKTFKEAKEHATA